jgi:hypothetical protein
MQFSVLYGEVAANFPTANINRCKAAVVAAYHEWLTAKQWSYRESTVISVTLTAGVSKYVLMGTSPVVPDFGGLISVGLELNTAGTVDPMFEFLQPDFDRFCGRLKANGQPAFFCVRGGTPSATSAAMTQGGQQQLQIAPPPLATADNGQNLQIAYFRTVNTMPLSADADVPLLPEQDHYALITGGNAYMAEAIGNPQKAQMFRQMFKERIAEAISNDGGMRGRDRVLLIQAPSASIYPITGQNPSTLDLSTRPYDRAS